MQVLMLIFFIVGNFIRCAGDANCWCFSSAFLTVWLPFRLMGPVFSFENSIYVVGEIIGSVLGALFETNVGFPFLPNATEETGYARTVVFLVWIWTILMSSLFYVLYNHWKPKVQ